MTGDVVKAMRACPQPDRRRRRRRMRRRRRHSRHGVGLPPGHAAREDGVPLHARRARGMRHGRLLDPAADHRPGTRRGAALHRPLHVRRGRSSPGASSTGSPPPSRCCAEALALAAQIAQGPTFAHAMTKRMLHAEWHLAVDAAIDAEAAGAGPLHADGGFPPRLPRLRGEATAAIRGRLTVAASTQLPRLAVLRRQPSRARKPLARMGSTRTCTGQRLPRTAQSVDDACRQLVRDLGRAGWTRYCVPQESGRRGRWRPCRSSTCAPWH